MKKGQKSPEAAWRFLRANERLKGVILAQLAERKLSRRRLAEIIGYAPARFDGFLRNVTTPNLSDYQIVKVCDYLGIELDLEIEIRG